MLKQKTAKDVMWAMETKEVRSVIIKREVKPPRVVFRAHVERSRLCVGIYLCHAVDNHASRAAENNDVAGVQLQGFEVVFSRSRLVGLGY